MLRVTEIFRSIQGESTHAGRPCTFVRLTGCPMRCVWCDSEYTFTGGEHISIEDVLKQVRAFGCHQRRSMARSCQLSDLEPLFVSQVCRFIGAPTSDLILLGPRVEPLPLGLVSKARRRMAGLNSSDS